MSDTEKNEAPKQEAEPKAKGKPKAKAEPEILIADQSVAFEHDGKPCTIIAGKTTARVGNPILKGREHLFKPLVIDFP